MVFVSCIFPASFLMILSYESGRMDHDKIIWCEMVCKNPLVTDIEILLISGSFFLMFFSGLGTNLHDFWCLANMFEI